MILGLSVDNFILLHVLISLAAIASGLAVAAAMLKARTPPAWTAVFLVSTVLTSVTGFLFPVPGLDPARLLGILSLVVLAAALFAFYGRRLAGPWRGIYVVSAVSALYFNAFVAVTQAFEKLGILHALAPTQKEPPFLLAQALLLAVAIGFGVAALRRFHPLVR